MNSSESGNNNSIYKKLKIFNSSFTLVLIGFFVIITLLAGLISGILGNIVTKLLGIFALACAVASLIISILNMTKKDKDKTLTIVAIVLSGIYVAVFLLIIFILYIYTNTNI